MPVIRAFFFDIAASFLAMVFLIGQTNCLFLIIPPKAKGKPTIKKHNIEMHRIYWQPPIIRFLRPPKAGEKNQVPSLPGVKIMRILKNYFFRFPIIIQFRQPLIIMISRPPSAGGKSYVLSMPVVTIHDNLNVKGSHKNSVYSPAEGGRIYLTIEFTSSCILKNT